MKAVGILLGIACLIYSIWTWPVAAFVVYILCKDRSKDGN